MSEVFDAVPVGLVEVIPGNLKRLLKDMLLDVASLVFGKVMST